MWRPLFFATAALVCTAACTDELTETLVVIDAAPEAQAAAGEVRLRVLGPDGATYDRRFASRSFPWPLTLPITPRDDDASRRFEVIADLHDDRGCRIATVRVLSQFVEARQTLLRLRFDAACVGVTDCGEGRTCVAGTCVDACASPGDLASPADTMFQPCDFECAAVDEVALGARHTCARAGEALYCWGSDERPDVEGAADDAHGAVGAASCGIVAEPARVATDVRVATVAAGDQTTCVVDVAGAVHCWGSDDDGVVQGGGRSRGCCDNTVGASFAEVWLAEEHACARDGSGTLTCWGQRACGQLADAPGIENCTATPDRGPLTTVSGFRALTASTGNRTTCALDLGGAPFCWGINHDGQLGAGVQRLTNEMPTARGEPQPVVPNEGELASAFVSLASVNKTTCALGEDGSLWCWGSHASGEVGAGELLPPPENSLASTRALQVGAGYRAIFGSGLGRHFCAIDVAGQLHCWGRNAFGQLGQGTADTTPVPTPLTVALPSGQPVRTGSVGTEHTCVVTDNGTLWCWGANDAAQLGLGDRDRRTSPAELCIRRRR